MINTAPFSIIIILIIVVAKLALGDWQTAFAAGGLVVAFATCEKLGK